jgi:predicted anti-sigma-YlaC factor YlaD
MSDCPGTDALATIAGALEWDVDEGVKHLTSCDACREQLRALRDVYVAYEASESVPEHVLARVGSAVAHEAARERSRGRKVENVGDVIEAILAGATAMAVLQTGGLDVPAALRIVVFGVVATSLFAYRTIRSSHSTAA